MDDLADSLKVSCPLLWTCITAAASNDECIPKLVTCAAILLQERNRDVNRIQTANSVMMYQSNLQKEGHTYLNHVGVGVSYDTLSRTLNEARALPEKELKQWKKDIEHYQTVCIVLSTHYYIITHNGLFKGPSINVHIFMSVQTIHFLRPLPCPLKRVHINIFLMQKIPMKIIKN